MYRSFAILSLALLSVMGTVSALTASKKRLCTEVCWINDIGNYDDCANRCYNSERPNDDEADECENCIDTCAINYLGDNPCLVVYTECRRGCFNKFFPTFSPAWGSHRERRDIEKEPEEHLPGVPKEFRKLLAGKDYPVGTEVCQIACRVKLEDTILSEKDQTEDCIDHCLQYPTHRDQEMQVALDCGNRCPIKATVINGTYPRVVDSQPCLQSCVSEMIEVRKLSVANAPPRPSRSSRPTSTTFGGFANKGAQKSTGQRYRGNPGSVNSTLSSTTSPITGMRKSSSDGSISYDSVGEANGAATTLPYFQSSAFIFHAVCSMIFAAAIGLHMI